MHPDLVRVLSDDYLAASASMDLGELYRAREELQEVEGQVSYSRRLAQGRIEVLCTEIERRETGGDADDLAALVGRLPDVLGGPTGGATTAVRDVEPDAQYAVEIEEIAGASVFLALPEIETGELDDLARRLEDAESRISSQRRELHARIDAVQCEIARRFRAKHIA